MPHNRLKASSADAAPPADEHESPDPESDLLLLPIFWEETGQLQIRHTAVMPGAMDGIQLADRVRSHYPLRELS